MKNTSAADAADIQIAVQNVFNNNHIIHPSKAPAPVHMICKSCGSTDVAADAYANWDSAENDWVLGTVYDHRQCHNCECATTLLEVSETDLSINIYGMIETDEGSRLVEHNEVADFFDVDVRPEFDTGEIFTLFEFENMTRAKANEAFIEMETKFPNAGVTEFLGLEI